MDALTFIAELVKAIAWPIVTLIIAFLFRDQIRALLARLRKGKLGSAELEFEEEVKALKQAGVELPTPSSDVLAPSINLAVTMPRVAIINEWLGVEEALYRLAQQRGLLVGGGARTAGRIIRLLADAKAIDSHQLSMLNALQALRNQAAHAGDFSPSVDSVLLYIQLARGLKETLERAARSG